MKLMSLLISSEFFLFFTYLPSACRSNCEIWWKNEHSYWNYLFCTARRTLWTSSTCKWNFRHKYILPPHYSVNINDINWIEPDFIVQSEEMKLPRRINQMMLNPDNQRKFINKKLYYWVLISFFPSFHSITNSFKSVFPTQYWILWIGKTGMD